MKGWRWEREYRGIGGREGENPRRKKGGYMWWEERGWREWGGRREGRGKRGGGGGREKGGEKRWRRGSNRRSYRGD